MAQQNVGFVGVGRMGGPMCRRLMEAGNSLTIFDKSDAAMRPLEALGAKRVDSPAAVASAAEIVLASLPTPPRCSDRLISAITAASVTAEMLTVPGNAACSCEQLMGETR